MLRRLLIPILAGLSLAACAPLVQRPNHVAADFAGPRLEDDAFVSFDGARLGLQHWEPAGGAPWAVIVGVHGMNDYSSAFRLAGPYWAKDGIATLAYDQRGFGRSPRHGVWAGDKLMTRDLATITALARQKYPGAIVAVAGESLGGAVAIEAFASGDSPAADRLVLLSPAVWGWSSQPAYSQALLWLTAHVDGAAVIKPPEWVTRGRYASDNFDELRRMGRDPLEIRGTRADAIFGLVTSMERASREVGEAKVPVELLAGAHDAIIPAGPMREAAKTLTPKDRSALYPNGWHLLLVDKQREVVFRDVESFLRDPAAPLPSGTAPIPGAGGR